MDYLLNARRLLVISLLCALRAFAQNADDAPALDDDDLPVTIRVLQDVRINAVQENADAADDAQPVSHYSLVTLGLRKDQQFQMIDIHLRGGCRISFDDEQYDLLSCPWLPGFDHQHEGIFMMMENF